MDTALLVLLLTVFVGVYARQIKPPSKEKFEFVPTLNGGLRLYSPQEIIEIQESLLAQPRATFAIKFFLFTRINPTTPQEIFLGDTASLTDSNFNPAWPTRIVIHGFNNDVTSPAITMVRNGYLNRDNFNVFAVDWSAGSSGINYFAAKDNIHITSDEVAEFMSMLNANGVPSSNIYLIGHSLGAHTAGLTGKKATTRPNTIYGLDPAGPLFDYDDLSGRLSPGDADYVQAIHTDSGRLGMDKVLGDADFYPNYGKDQPGCGIDVAGICCHGRANSYLLESLQVINLFLGKKCDYNQIWWRICTGTTSTALMGGEPSNPSIIGSYYLPVNSVYPFGTGSV